MAIAQKSSTTADSLDPASISFYRRNGFVHVSSIISPDEAAEFRGAALSVAERMHSYNQSDVFTQLVNAWREDHRMRRLTLHPNIAAVAQKLAGVKLRLWHDQILIKKPHNQVATQFHQDQPYWPHVNSLNPISAWIALCDVPVERGCMTFIPGSHTRSDLPAQRLDDSTSLFRTCPELEWEPRVTVPLRAGDCTFHHGRCAHMATPNFTDEPRVAHVVIFMDHDTFYTGSPHVVTDSLGLPAGMPLEHELFPAADEIIMVS